MGASRENANIWWCLFGRYPSGDWRGWRLFKRNFWSNGYLIQDSFLTPFNRLIGCKLFGHRDVKEIRDDEGKRVHHCFCCYRYIKEAR